MVGLAIPPGLFVGAVSGLAATTFTNTVSAGVIVLSALAALATVVGIVYGVKWKIAYAVEVKAREGEAALNSALEDRVRTVAHERDELVQKLDQMNDTLKAAQKTIARLEPLGDMAKVLEMVTKSFEQLIGRQEAMHAENKLRTDQQTKILLDRLEEMAA